MASISAFVRPLVLLLGAPLVLLSGCGTMPPPAPAPAPAPPPLAAAPAPAPPPPAVTPVEVEPVAPAVQPMSLFSQLTQGPEAAMLSYADRIRGLPGPELAAELSRLGEPDTPTTQMQAALVLAQTRVPADLARALGLMQRVIANPSPEARPLQPLARALAARYLEQRRVEDDRDRQAQQARESQRRIEQLTDRLEALRAIERSFARPANGAPTAPVQVPAPPAARPTP